MKTASNSTFRLRRDLSGLCREPGYRMLQRPENQDSGHGSKDKIPQRADWAFDTGAQIETRECYVTAEYRVILLANSGGR